MSNTKKELVPAVVPPKKDTPVVVDGGLPPNVIEELIITMKLLDLLK